jgi:hypothetical protein
MSAHRRQNRRPEPIRLGLLLVAAAGLTVSVAGCEDQQTMERLEAVEAANESAQILERVHRYGTAAAPAEERREAYEEAIRTLSDDANKGLDIQQAALNSLMARSHAGLTDLRSFEILDLERRAASLAEQVRQTADAISRVRQNADLLSDYDPTAERQLIADQRADTNTELAALRQQERRLETRLNQLTDEAGQHRRAFENYRVQAEELRSQVQQALGAESRFELVTEATDFQRQAADEQRQYAELTAQADALRPELERVQQLIEYGEKYLEILREAESDVEGRLLRRQEAAADQEQLADQFIEQAGNLYSDLTALAETELSAAYEDAVSEAERAIRAARAARSKASSDSREAAATALARYQQALGRLQWQHARALDAYADALEPLRQIEGLPEREALTANLERMLAARDQLLQEATQAYSDALDTLDGVRGERALQDTVAGLREQLWKIRAVTSGGEFPAEETEMNGDMGMDAAPDEAMSAAGDPLEALFAAVEAIESGDFEAATASFYTDDPDAQYVIDAWMDAARRVDRLDQACRNVFGMSLSECWDEYAADNPDLSDTDRTLRADAMAMQGAMQGALGELTEGSLDRDDFDVTMQGDTATVIHLPSGAEIRMIRVNQTWFIYQDPAPAALAQMEQRVDEEAARTVRYPQIAARVESGEIGTIEELVEALRSQ